MIELIDELNAASGLLQTALDRYLGACSAVQNYYTQTARLTGIPRTLLDRVSTELLSAISYERSLKQAKSIISQAKNHPAAVPIHSLPAEILTSIFYLVVGAPCCVRDKDGENTSLPRYPDFLSHVCSRWRQIILGLPMLWSHVDLLYHHSLGEGFAARAESCANRAGDLPLDIHIRMPASHRFFPERGMNSFLRSTAARARSIELAIPSTLDHIPEPLFESCFDSCVPGTLVELAITDHGQYTPDFIVPYEGSDDEPDPDGLLLSVSKENFEDLLLSVTNLRLDGLYPAWTSQAYHGLVELHLMSTHEFGISESDLYAILEASPGLRILHFGLYIDIEGLSLAIAPVCLKSLEVLDLGTLYYTHLAAFLGLVSTGSTPLQLTIKYYGTISLRSEDKVTKFFKHSNITKLRLNGSDQCPPPEIPPTLIPQLRTLVLDGFRNTQTSSPQPHPPRGDAHRSLPLNAIYILNSHLDLDSTQQMVRDLQRPIQAIVFWRSYLWRDDKSVDDTVVNAELSKFCSVVEPYRWLQPNPLKDWA